MRCGACSNPRMAITSPDTSFKYVNQNWIVKTLEIAQFRRILNFLGFDLNENNYLAAYFPEKVADSRTYLRVQMRVRNPAAWDAKPNIARYELTCEREVASTS